MPRDRHILGLVLLLMLHVMLLPVGCVHPPLQVAAPPSPAPFQQFIAPNFDWTTVKRVVLMPMDNQSAFAHASVELQTNLAAEFQRTGRFDIVMATREDPGARARDIFSSGNFDELELLRIAREYDAQAILFGRVTQYHPYAPPRVGLSLIMISPAEGVAIASSDGLWDARELSTSRQAQGYLKENLSWRQGLMGVDRALESPDVYQRFVCQQIASSLTPPELKGPPPAMMGSPAEILPAGYQSESSVSPSQPVRTSNYTSGMGTGQSDSTPVPPRPQRGIPPLLGKAGPVTSARTRPQSR